MKKITNEKKFVKQTLENKCVSVRPNDTIRLLAKHYFNEGLDRESVANEVETFMRENFKGYKSFEWNKKIKDVVKKVADLKVYTLSEIDKVNVTDGELNVISTLDNLDHEKLAFALLVHAKVGNAMKNKYVDGNWVNSDPKEIATDAKISRNEIQQGKMRFELKSRGLIDAPKGSSVKVNFIDNKSEVAIVITDFEDYINKYLMWKGTIKSIKCAGEDCLEQVEVRSNRQKYCAECSRIRRNEGQKKRDRAKIKQK